MCLREKESRKVIKYPNEHLREVELVGFVGCAIDIELTVNQLESAIKLEKIVINPRSPILVGTPWEFVKVEGKRTHYRMCQAAQEKSTCRS